MTEAHLVLAAGRTTLIVTSIVLFLAAILCFLGWMRGAFRPRIGFLEILRFVIVAAVLFALNEPEWVRTEQPTQKPSVVVFWDDSDSMRTRDVLADGAPTSRPISRQEWTAPRVAPSAWAPIQSEFDVEIVPFSSSPDETARAAGTGGPETDLAKPLAEALEKMPGLRAAVVISDGDWNTGQPPVDVAMRYRAKDVPIFTAAVGSPTAMPDLAVAAVDAPKFAILGKPLQVPYTIRSAMPRDVDGEIAIAFGDGESADQSVKIPAKSFYEGEFSWTPRRAGPTTIKVSVPVQEGEFDVANNERTITIDVRDETIKVLLIDSYPRWEYRYFRNAAVRDEGVDVSCLLFHPDLDNRGGGPHYIKSFPSKRELAEYDVVFLGDVGLGAKMLSHDDCEQLKGLVEQQASGLILVPGFRGHQHSLLSTPLADLFPVELDAARPKGIGGPALSRFALTEEGRDSSLTKLAGDLAENARIWEAFPGFQWHAGALRARPGSKTLVVHRDASSEYGRYPMLAIRPFGAGKVLFMGTDNIWKWREGVEDRFHYRFWAQVARWMSYQRKMAAGRSMRLFYSPDRPEVGHRVTLNANVMDASGEPMEEATVSAIAIGPDKSRQVVRLNREKDGDWGLFRGSFEPKVPGMFEVHLTCRETGEALDTLIEVYGSAIEQKGLPARPEVMDELSRVSRGARFETEGVGVVLAALKKLPPPPPSVVRTRIWADPRWGSALVLLMGIFWIGRKMSGRF